MIGEHSQFQLGAEILGIGNDADHKVPGLLEDFTVNLFEGVLMQMIMEGLALLPPFISVCLQGKAICLSHPRSYQISV